MKKKYKIGIIHHNILEHKGGGDFVCAWFLESLKNEYEITYLTWGRNIDFNEVNNYYGTNIKNNEINVLYNFLLTRLKLNNRPYHLILALLELFVKKYYYKFDLLISTYNEFDFYKKGIQYIHGPSRSDYAAQLYLTDYKNSILRNFYHKSCDFFSGFNFERMKKNLTLVNSNWTGNVVKKVFGEINTITLYPPVLIDCKNTWEKRETGFLCIGDLLPEKKVIEAINLIGKLREIYKYNIHLHIIGNGTGSYAQKVKNICKKYKWIFFEGRMNREEISKIINNHKYGIHMRNYEGFGIAVAEMAKGGCIPFIPEGGGQTEAIGNNTHLLFRSEEEAVSKIKFLLDSPSLQIEIQKYLLSYTKIFSIDNFKNKLKSCIESFFNL